MTEPYESPLNPELHAVNDFMQEAVDSIIERNAGRSERLQKTCEDIGPDLPITCLGKVCPILANIAIGHHTTKFRIALDQNRIEELGISIDLIHQNDEITYGFYGKVMDRVSDGSITANEAEKLMTMPELPADLQPREVDTELLLRETIHTIYESIAEKTERLRKTEEIFETIGVKEHKPNLVKGTLVSIRRTFNLGSKENECLGTKYDPNVANRNKRDVCTNPRAIAALYDAIDQGLVKLDGYDQCLDTRTTGEALKQ